MTRFHTLAAAALLGLAACASGTDTMETNAASALVGKNLVAENGNTFILNPDGTVGGTFGGEPLVGTFSASEGEICSTYTAPARLAGQEFCSTPDIDGGTVVFNRRDGSQSALYNIQG